MFFIFVLKNVMIKLLEKEETNFNMIRNTNREIIRMGTDGKINLFEKAEYQSIASLLSDN